MTNTDISIAGFATLAILIYALVVTVLARRRMGRRLRLAMGGQHQGRSSTPGATELRVRFLGFMGFLGNLLPLGDADRGKIARGLQRAGFRSENALLTVLGAKLVALAAGLVGGFVLLLPALPGALGLASGLAGGVCFGVALNLLPELVVSRLAALRMRRIRSGLADAFDLLIVCLESGNTFERALQRTVADLRVFRPDLAAELRQVSLDLNLHGRTREAAIGRLVERLDSQEFRDLSSAIVGNEQQGTPVAEALRNLAASHRVETISAIQAKTARLPILLILPTIVFVLPGMMVILGGPAMVKLTESLSVGGS